jgi:hypothetical protein
MVSGIPLMVKGAPGGVDDYTHKTK